MAAQLIAMIDIDCGDYDDDKKKDFGDADY